VSEKSDEQWCALLAARDGDAVADLRAALCRGLRSALAGRADASAADDFAQEATLRVLDRLDSFRGDSRFLTWAQAVAVRVAFSELRKARYRDVSLDALAAARALPEPAAPPAPDPGAALDRETVFGALRRLIETDLTEKQRAVMRAELDGVPQAVIAERLGTNRNALYKLGHDARMKLKRGLEAAGFSADVVRSVLDGASGS
jgi:RNA polymerase sigma-70 factor, ECF subfamily